jgi:hypothetical protein
MTDKIDELMRLFDRYMASGVSRHRNELRQALEAALKPGDATCKSDLQVRTTGWAAPRNHYAVPVLFNPYTGEPRDVRDVQSDPQGVLIVPPGKV